MFEGNLYFRSSIVGNILKNHTDEELLIIYRAEKSAEVINVLFQRYYHLVYGVCMKYFKNSEDSKDASMQIFGKLLDDLLRHEIQFFKAWLYRVAQNHCLMQLRSQKHDTVSFEIIGEPGMEYEDSMHPALEKEDLLSKMEEAMTTLGEEQSTCIKLFYLEKKTYTEIMDLTGFTFMQVKSFIQNGKRNLKLKITADSNG